MVYLQTHSRNLSLELAPLPLKEAGLFLLFTHADGSDTLEPPGHISCLKGLPLLVRSRAGGDMDFPIVDATPEICHTVSPLDGRFGDGAVRVPLCIYTVTTPPSRAGRRRTPRVQGSRKATVRSDR